MPEEPKEQQQGLDITAPIQSMIKLGELVGSTLRLPGLRRHDTTTRRAEPGSRPGIEHLAETNAAPEPGQIKITCTDYAPDRIELTAIEDLDVFLNQCRPDWVRVRWVNIDGLHPNIINRFREHHGFHTLAAEDVLNVPQRPKVETYDDHLFIVARMLMYDEGQLIAEQISFFVYEHTLITFQERHGDVWQPIRTRINTEGSRLRNHDTDYLLYALLDSIVDQCFPILERYGDLLEKLEAVVLDRPTPDMQRRIHMVKRQLVVLRRVMWPTRELVGELYRDENDRLSKFAKTYMRDVYDHAVQVIDVIETYREMTGGLTDLYMSAVSNRMNEVMKVLTIMASFFIPITFLAGVYGMNFDMIPELHWKYAYLTFWIIVAVTVILLAIFFYRKGWIGRRAQRDEDSLFDD